MSILFRMLCIAAMIVALPLAAQEAKDKDGKKKDEPKKEETKKDEPKSETPKKEEPKAQPKQRYKDAGAVAGKVTEVDTSGLTIEIEVTVYAGRRKHEEKVEYKIADDYVVRNLNLPERIDDKNKPIPYTGQEKAKLKGNNPKLPGYTSEPSALKKGQVVALSLGTPYPTPGTPKKKAGEPDKPVVTMVVIQIEEAKMTDKKKK